MDLSRLNNQSTGQFGFHARPQAGLLQSLGQYGMERGKKIGEDFSGAWRGFKEQGMQYPSLDELTAQRGSQKLSDEDKTNILSQVADLIPVGGAVLHTVRGIKNPKLYRGVEEFTLDKAWEAPRSMGAHVAVNERISRGFTNAAEMKVGGGKGELWEIDNISLKPLQTVDAEVWEWNPYTTLKALKKKGLDKLSKKGQYKLEKVANEYLAEKSSRMMTDVAEEALTVQYNKRFIKILKDEGYDSLQYEAVEGPLHGRPGEPWTSYIIFEKPKDAIFSKLDHKGDVSHIWSGDKELGSLLQKGESTKEAIRRYNSEIDTAKYYLTRKVGDKEGLEKVIRHNQDAVAQLENYLQSHHRGYFDD